MSKSLLPRIVLALIAFPPWRGPAGDEPLCAKVDLAKLEGIARDLASRGREAETNELLDVLHELRDDAVALSKTRDACAKAQAKVKTPASGVALSGVAHSLHALATDMSKELGALALNRRGDLATQILRLDDDQPEPHKLFSHVLEKGKWVDPERTRLLARRAEIQAAVVKARKFEVPLTTAPSNHPLLAELGVGPGTEVRYGSVTFHSDMPADRIERIVRRGLQAIALSKFLRGFPLEIPDGIKKERDEFVVLSSLELYLKALDLTVKAHRIAPDHALHAKEQGGFIDDRDLYVEYEISEVYGYASAASHFVAMYYDPRSTDQPCLVMGHLDWLCLALFGTEPPGVVREAKPGAPEEKRTSDQPRDSTEEKRAQSLSKAGISGARRWLLFKAARGEDPAWSNSFVNDVADLEGLDLLKSTFVVEYLQELSRFDPLLRATAMKVGEKRSRAEVIEAALPEGLRGFEKNFHAWLLPRTGGVAQGLVAPAVEAEKPSKEELAALAAVDRVRKSCWDEKLYGPYVPMQSDHELSAGCALHAHYLKQNPDQLERWPDAHEEYPEKEGFSSEGCWSGTHSVIAPGVANADEAVAGWIGTFYHRLPLLDPGLKRIGFALADKCAVLDADSLLQPDELEGSIVYPPRDGSNVPTRFTPGGELPHPVPGVDEREFGFPITLQTTCKAVEYHLRLARGPAADGPEVPCWLSTPGHPTYIELAPPNAFCLMPKARLAPKTKYTVTAEPADGGTKITWSFTTGD